MTRERREALKQAVDAVVREREANGSQRTACKGCGVPEDRYVAGCRTCWNRKYNRVKRAA